ncbi:MAG: hypothetical protein GX620_02765 [Chloroflexi bacterium]|nr:hypothetical protein [Chloroflexota bacterium]
MAYWIGDLRPAIVLAALLILPGWAVLSVGHTWRRWVGLQRWCVAIGISIAFYPALFYGTRFLFPRLTLGPYKMGSLLLACLVIIMWRLRGQGREIWSLDSWEWLAVGLVGATLFTRIWIVRDRPYPAWSDSLHHAILTQLTAVQGQLPQTMEPYFPAPLNMYHLGLYSLSASVEWLARVPAHSSLLWTVQALNGLCGVGVYLVLDRKVGRKAAVVGLLIVGLLSHQPSLYVNWGRSTQIASQTILLIAWIVAWEDIASWRAGGEKISNRLWRGAISGLLIGSVFLLHFRVAVYLLPLLAGSLLLEWVEARRQRHIWAMLTRTVIVATCALLVVVPAATRMLMAYLDMATTALDPVLEFEQPADYYAFPLETTPYLAGEAWLMALAGLSAVLALIRGNRFTLIIVAWVVVLYLFGEAYRFGVPLISFTNLGAVLILMYLPIGLLVGVGVEELLGLLSPRWSEAVLKTMPGVIIITGFLASHIRVLDIEPYRYFVTSADVTAMDWIRQNTESDARFAVNTYFWLNNAPHGTDGGYWIPYFTGRQTTAGVMLTNLGSQQDWAEVVTMSRAVEGLEAGNGALRELRALGVDYIYVGPAGDFSGEGLDAERIAAADGVTLAYQRDGVSVLRIEGRPHGAP